MYSKEKTYCKPFNVSRLMGHLTLNNFMRPNKTQKWRKGHEHCLCAGGLSMTNVGKGP